MLPARVDLSVIIPAYNEAKRLAPTLTRLHNYLGASGLTYEILVVLDGCSDNTRAIVHELNLANVKVIDRTVNRGKGYTVKEGMLNASGVLRLFSDADNSTDIAHLEAMKPLFDNGYDLVIASRHSNDVAAAIQAVPQVCYKQLFGRAGNAIVQLLAVPGIWDTQCGFKAFRGDVAERIFCRTTIDGWGFDIEVLALARALKYRVGIIPAYWINDASSHFGGSDYWRVLCDILTIRHNLKTCKYDL
jgi:dolichyl-phosphate beta-glucosyltransferase